MREDGEIVGILPLMSDLFGPVLNLPIGPGQCGNEPTLDNEFGFTPAMGEMETANVV